MHEGIKNIGTNAFSDCYSLKSISIPNTVTSIGPGAFSGCGGLQNISLPNNNENEKDKKDVEIEELKEYLNLIRNIKPQSREEERNCILRIREGDKEAKDELICANLRFVANIARKYANYGVPLLELIQEGNIGLIKSIPNFDLEKGTRLSTYAHANVRTAIIRAIDELKRFIRMPVHACDMAKKLAKINGYLAQELNRIPTIEEISKESGIDIEDIEHIYRASFPIASINSPIKNDFFEDDSDEATIEDIIEDQSISRVEEQAIRRLTREDLISILESFKERDREIIYHLFGFYDGFTKTFDEVGDIYGVSRQNIGQIKDKIIKNIRKSSENIQMLRISDEIITPVTEDYGALVKDDDTFESLINKLIDLLPQINPTHIIILFESMKASNIEVDNIRALYVKYGYTEKQIEEIRESVSKEISKNEKAKYLYYRIIEKREDFLLQGEVIETSVSQANPGIKLLKRRMPYEDQYDLEIINYTLGLLNNPTMQEIIDEELFDYDQQIIKCLKKNQESEEPKSLEEFLSKFNLSIEQVKETALVCLDFFFERKYNIFSKDQEELKDNIYKKLLLDLLVCS